MYRVQYIQLLGSDRVLLELNARLSRYGTASTYAQSNSKASIFNVGSTHSMYSWVVCAKGLDTVFHHQACR